MQRRIWSLEELAQILLATNEANANADFLLSSGMLDGQNQAVIEAYRAGFKAALGSVALAIGVPVSSLRRRVRHDDTEGIPVEARLLPPL